MYRLRLIIGFWLAATAAGYFAFMTGYAAGAYGMCVLSHGYYCKAAADLGIVTKP